MNILTENHMITESSCGSNFCYILEDNSLFMGTEYKMLQGKNNISFAKCMKLMYNGKIELCYLTRGLKSFSAMLTDLDADSFLKIVGNILANVVDVQHYGFLSCQKVDISFDHIFVDPATFKVSLVYLPLSKVLYSDEAVFENELRTNLIKLISSKPSLSSAKNSELSGNLANGTYSIEDLYEWIKKGKKRWEKSKPVASTTLIICSMDSKNPLRLTMCKERFVVGKNPAAVDGVIGFNKMISRIHCRLDKEPDGYVITDLQSANGTYVNNVKLAPNKPCRIKNGDMVRLANSDFQILIT